MTEEKIIGVLREAEAGAKVRELCRRNGISEATFSPWKARYGGMDVSQLRRLKKLEAENARLKRMYADLSLTHHALPESEDQDVIAIIEKYIEDNPRRGFDKMYAALRQGSTSWGYVPTSPFLTDPVNRGGYACLTISSSAVYPCAIPMIGFDSGRQIRPVRLQGATGNAIHPSSLRACRGAARAVGRTVVR